MQVSRIEPSLARLHINRNQKQAYNLDAATQCGSSLGSESISSTCCSHRSSVAPYGTCVLADEQFIAWLLAFVCLPLQPLMHGPHVSGRHRSRLALARWPDFGGHGCVHARHFADRGRRGCYRLIVRHPETGHM